MGDFIATFGGLAKDISAALLVAYFVIQIFRGKWVSWRMYERLVTDRDKWQAIAQKESEANAVLLDQNSDLIEANQTGLSVLKAIPPKGDAT